MIKSLELKNFQSHRDTFIAFHEGVNAVVGLSDSGKTAILRALYWVIFNRPDGDDFQSHWGGDTECCLEVDGGVKITRRRTKSDNAYFLDIPGQDRQEFRAFGRFQVPIEIQAVLNMNDINFQSQLDAPFLLSSSPGEVAQILNKVVNLDVIDSALSNIRKKKKSCDDEFKASQIRIKDLTSQLEGFRYLGTMESDIIVLETLGVHRDRLKTRAQNLKAVVTQADTLQARKQQAFKLLEAEQDVVKVLGLHETRKQLNGRSDVLFSLLDQIDKKTKSLVSANNLVDAATHIDSALLLVSKKKELEARKQDLSALISDYKRKYRQKSDLDSRLQELTAEFKAEMPEICPLCEKGA